MRVLIAGILGGIAMFIWTGIAHTATPLGQIGFSQMHDEGAVLDSMHGSLGNKSGLYFFPWADMNQPDGMEKRAAAVKVHPWGWMIYHPPGTDMAMGPSMIAEFLKETVQSIIAAFLVSLMVPLGFLMRMGAVTLIGVSAGLATNASYLIWYGFPLDYTLVQIFIEIVGAVAAGAAIAFWLGRRPAAR